MLSKIVVIFRKPKPSPAVRSGDDHTNNPQSSALKIIHPGGTTEHYYMATPAARIIDEYYPSFILARPDVFRKPWESVVKRDEILTPGQKFFVVPRQTIKKLRRRSRRIKKGIKVVPSNHASSDQMISLAESSSGSFLQRSSIIKAASDEKTKQRSRRRRVRFFGVDAVEGSSDFATSSESNGRSRSKSRREQRNRRARAWNPSLTVITEK
nr:Myeloid-associated differentiation marker-like protein [Ipomoea batatas]